MAVFTFINASFFFLKKLRLFLEVVATGRTSVYFACQVKAAACSTHRVWEDVFVCTTTAAVFQLFPPLPSQTPPSIPHQALQFAPLKSSLFVSSECPPPHPPPHPLLLRL